MREMPELIADTIAKIPEPDEAARKLVAERLSERMGGDPSGLGVLQEFLLRYVGATGQTEPERPAKCTVICCGDHGVAEMQVSAYPPATTAQMAKNYLISQGAAANALANFAESDLLVVDVGIAADTADIPGLVQRKIAFGTKNIAKGPAMTREQAAEAIEAGIKIAAACAENGYRCFLPGEMGIANTTSSAAVCAAICSISPEEATGRGTNISEERLRVKIDVVGKALAVNEPDPDDGLDVLAKVGGFEIGCIAGIILGAAAHRACVILDGFNAGAAALIAAALSPACRPYLIASQLAAEQGHRAVLEKLGLAPCMNMQFRLGEACGSSLAADLLDAAIHAYDVLGQDDETFSSEDFLQEAMPKEPPKVTDRTFNFYLRTMPVLDRVAMKSCQQRIDALAKPIYCLGYLEQIAAELAGIAGEDRPDKGVAYSHLCFTHGTLSPRQSRLIKAFADHGEAEVTIARLRPSLPPTAAFDFGRVTAEDLTFNVPLLGISMTEANSGDTDGTMARALREALLEDGRMRYGAEEFLSHVPQQLKVAVSAVMGAIIAGTHNSSLVILDGEATEIIARYTEAVCPACKPYILHVQPALLQLGVTAEGGILAGFGKRIVDAALFMLNDMKTFAETGVSVAGDGPGKGKQGA